MTEGEGGGAGGGGQTAWREGEEKERVRVRAVVVAVVVAAVILRRWVVVRGEEWSGVVGVVCGSAGREGGCPA
jgi:ABC-type methionine transport system permease subunit